MWDIRLVQEATVVQAVEGGGKEGGSELPGFWAGQAVQVPGLVGNRRGLS